MGQPLSLFDGLSHTYSKMMSVKKINFTFFSPKNLVLFDSIFTSLQSEMSIPGEISMGQHLLR